VDISVECLLYFFSQESITKKYRSRTPTKDLFCHDLVLLAVGIIRVRSMTSHSLADSCCQKREISRPQPCYVANLVRLRTIMASTMGCIEMYKIKKDSWYIDSRYREILRRGSIREDEFCFHNKKICCLSWL